MHCVSVKLWGHIHRLRPELADTSHATTKWDRPHVPIASLPVCVEDRPGREIPALFHVVVHEVLQRHLIYIAAVRGARNRPHVINQRTQRPMARLHETHDGWTDSQLALAQDLAGRR